MAFVWAVAGWWIWPVSSKWWGFVIISILLILSALLFLIGALRAMGRIYRRDRAWAEYMALGGKPKSSKMASYEALRKAGVINE